MNHIPDFSWNSPFFRWYRAMSLMAVILVVFAPLSPSSSRAEWLEPYPTITHTEEKSRDVLQFESAGHVLGFKPDSIYAANAQHSLQIRFLGAQFSQPAADEKQTQDQQTRLFQRVKYAELWPGIDLIFDAVEGGLYKSTYLIAPGASPDQIRLAYNREIHLGQDGRLHIGFERGEMVESSPVAWQEIDGVRRIVPVSFRLDGEKSAGFQIGPYDPAYALVIDPSLSWITFLGAGSEDCTAAVQFYNDVIFIVGASETSWGSPLRAHSGGKDAYAARLNKDGGLDWLTFLGGSGNDEAFDVAVDAAGNLFVVGDSRETWGTPARAHAGNYDAFVARISYAGNLTWNTFLGSSEEDRGRGITYSPASSLFVTGFSAATWGPPIAGGAFNGAFDAFVAQVNTGTGALLWNTFLGSGSLDRGMDLIATASEIFVTGYSSASWGADPYRNYMGGNDAFLAALNAITGAFEWNTFMGSSSNEEAWGIALDANGNIYVIGTGRAHWQGTNPPVRAYSGSSDAFVVKFNAFGLLLWNTFLGSNLEDDGSGIVLKGNDYIYVAGTSAGSWSNPSREHSGGRDAFMAQLSLDGTLNVNSFFGTAGTDWGYGIAVNYSGVPYLVGESEATWANNPIRLNHGWDGFTAYLTTAGNLMWATFQGGASDDGGRSIAVDPSGNLYIAGYSDKSWGSPRRAHSGGYDAFVAKLDHQGNLLWNTFLGGSAEDRATGIAFFGNDTVYVVGSSLTNWGTPVRAYVGGKDAFVARLNGSGAYQWHAFLGSASTDSGLAVAVSSNGYPNVVGQSYATWGTPRRAFVGWSDGFAAELNGNGSLLWNTFLGGGNHDYSQDVLTDEADNLFITGTSSATWGSPVRAHSGAGIPNAFVAKLNTSGDFSWNTFLGGMGETGFGIDQDGDGNVFVTGSTYNGFAFPIRSCTVNYDAYVAKLSHTGALVWNTCLGVQDGLSDDAGNGIAVDSAGNSYVIGYSRGTWGSPLQPYTGGMDIFVAHLDNNGALRWNTFLGSKGDDTGSDLVRGAGEWIGVGDAFGGFGVPVRSAEGSDAVVFRLSDPISMYLPIVLLD